MPFDSDDEILGKRPYPIGAAITAAGGEHELGHWSAWVTPTTDGVMFEVLLDGHGGGGGSIGPMGQGDISVGWSTGGTVNLIDGQASARVARIQHVLDDGRTIDAIVFDLPERLVGPLRAHAAFVAGGGRISGETVAFDAGGHEVARVEWGRDDPDGSTDEAGEGGGRRHQLLVARGPIPPSTDMSGGSRASKE